MRYRCLWLAVSLLLLAGCAGAKHHGFTSTREVTLNIASYEDVIRVQREYSGKDTSYRGYAIWQGNKCNIWIVPVDYFVTEELWHTLLGHELRHCFFGHFHN